MPQQAPEQVPPRARASSGAAIAVGWIVTVVFNIALPIVTYDVLADRGVGQVPALLLSGVWPAVEIVFRLLKDRRVDEFGLMVLVFIAVGVISMLAFNSPRLVLVKESAGFGLFGLVLLASLLAPRPLMFYFGRRFATNGDPARIDWWNGLWQYPGFRRSQRMLTVVWGVAVFLTAAVCIALTYLLSVDTMVVITNVVPYVVMAGLVMGTAVYGKRSGERRRQQAVQ
ncbi:VC0807 family protein [Amycolatopsis taiwanensis]|uniref:DUF3159 domain-containing protein n=1 Tax=Amycolatopsis taiwanensis TaxID=342230 RepID=A0A9W6VIW6_9PSEU|nr:VC0807 family protein [Amycolatopsis taiwanensis]GLY70115.1 hypothetical protein Atai01_67340 [Amycolatopsis taiwanensis]